MAQTLVMYTRTYGCPYVTLAKRVLQQESVPYQEVFIDKTEEPASLAHGTSPRGIDRGAMITEPSSDELLDWLRKHHFIG
jgi:hypothetical protein